MQLTLPTGLSGYVECHVVDCFESLEEVDIVPNFCGPTIPCSGKEYCVVWASVVMDVVCLYCDIVGRGVGMFSKRVVH